VFKYDPNAGTITDIADFDNTTGYQPNTPVIMDSGGNLFGTTSFGGASNAGTVFELPANSGSIETVASLDWSTTGEQPNGGLVEDASGNLYGTTQYGGNNNAGMVYEVSSSGSISGVASFDWSNTGGAPSAGLALDSLGDLFGTTTSGGSGNCGTVFEIPAGSGSISPLFSFNGADGDSGFNFGGWDEMNQIMPGVVVDSSGNIYGEAAGGGGANLGTVYELTGSVPTATQAVFTTPPAATFTAGDSQSFAVGLETAGGVVDALNSSDVTLSIASGPDGATIGGTLTATADNGVASFSGLIFDTAGTYTLTASVDGLLSATTSSFTVGAGDASQLVVTAEPNATAVAGQSIGTVTADVEDQFGNLVTDTPADVQVSSSAAGVNSDITTTAGVASFTGLSIDTAGQYTLTLSADGLTSADAAQVTITPAAAAQLVVTAEPNATAVAGQSIGTVTADVEDQFGNLVTDTPADVQVSSSAAGANSDITTTAGVASFTGLSIDTAGQYTLTLSADGLTSADATQVTVTPDAAAQLVVIDEPNSTAVAGQSIGTVTADVEDQFGNLVTDTPADLEVSSSAAGVNSDITTTAGVASFSGLLIDTAGQYTLTLSADGLTSADTTQVTITPDVAAQLVVTAEPNSTAVAGLSIGTVTADVEDVFGNLVNTDSSTVNISASPTVYGTASVQAANGVATFSGLSIHTAGQYSLTLTDNGLASATTTQLTITPAAASKLVVTGEPNTTAVAGQSIGTVTAKVEDTYGNLVNTDTSTIAISTGATIYGTASAAAVAGVATLSGLSMHTAGQYSLTLADNGLASATTTQLTITPAAASKLVVTGQPNVTALAGQSIGTVTAKVEDTYGNLVNTDTSTIAISTGATIYGTASAAAVAGVATLSGLSMHTAGQYSLTLTDNGLASATTTQLTITPAAASKLVVTGQPDETAVAGQSIGTVTAKVEDTYGNLESTNTSTVRIAAAETLHGTTGVAAVAGVATFTGLSIDTAGGHVLTLSDSGLTSATTGQVTVTPAAASQLVVTAQPDPSATAGQSVGPVNISVEDAYGNVVTTDTSPVSLASAMPLNGTTTVAAVAGIATFAGLSTNLAGTFTLTATDGELTTATTNALTVTPAAAAQLVVTTQPETTTVAGQSVGSVNISVEDAYGNVVTTDASAVSLASTASLSGATTVNASNGVASFSDVAITTVGTYALTATDGTLTPTAISAVTITPAAAAQLVVTGQPVAATTDGKPLGTITVDVEDAYGNLVATDASPVTLATTTALDGTTTVDAANGVAAFSDISIPTAGVYTLTATDGNLTPATTSPVTITTGVVQTAGKTGITWTLNVSTDLPQALSAKWLTVKVTGATAGGATVMTTRVRVKNGIANFKGLNLHTTGIYNVTATDAAGNSITRQITVVPAAATHLAFTTLPEPAGTATTVVVRAVDRYGNTTTTSDGTTVSLRFVPQAGYTALPTLHGTIDAVLTGGVATFPDVTVTGHGRGRLIAAGAGIGFVRAQFFVVN
jgi:uncharacterized repeat protein (TIGR03803 family)